MHCFLRVCESRLAPAFLVAGTIAALASEGGWKYQREVSEALPKLCPGTFLLQPWAAIGEA